MSKFKFGDKVNCIHGVGIVTITYFDYEFDEFICEVVFILDGKTCTYKSLENELTKVSEWIPCSECMPEFNVRVLVVSGNRFTYDFLLNMETHSEWASMENLDCWMYAPEMPGVK